MKNKTLKGLGDLVRLLPTGTVFIFRFFNPVFTNNGNCNVINKIATIMLVGVCGISCFISTFTDSYADSECKTHNGIATLKGLWPSSGSENSSAYKIRLGDFVHAFFSLVAFTVVSLMDSNTVKYFYPSLEANDKILFMALCHGLPSTHPLTHHGLPDNAPVILILYIASLLSMHLACNRK